MNPNECDNPIQRTTPSHRKKLTTKSNFHQTKSNQFTDTSLLIEVHN